MEEQEHNMLERSLGRVEGKLDSVVHMVSATSSEVKSLRDDFNTMEKGRLTSLEVKFAGILETIQGMKDGNAQKIKNWSLVYGGIISIGVSIISALITFMIIHK